jgi:predicted HTH transcriptional regulator
MRKIKNEVEFTYKTLAQELNVSEKTIERDIGELKNEDKIEFSGSSKKGNWKIVKNNK